MSTYTLISSQVLGSSAASVTFSSIPQTYKDLVLRVSARSDYSGAASTPLKVIVNSVSTGTQYSDTRIVGNGSSASSSNDTNSPYWYLQFGVTAAGSVTSNVFASGELYIPNYTSSANKPMSLTFALEDNSSSSVLGAYAMLDRTTSAVSQLDISPSSGNFITGSSFYLYGI